MRICDYGRRFIRPTANIAEVTMTKTLACISMIAFAITLQSAFAQTADTPAPSPLHSAPAANPATSADPTATPTKAKQGRRNHSGKPGTSSTGAPAPQSN
jgi:hypothetical protein